MAIVVDHTRFKQLRPGEQAPKRGRASRGAGAGNEKKHWWQEADEATRAKAALGAFKVLKATQAYRETKYIRHSCLYGVSQMRSLSGNGYARDVISVKERVPQNIVRQAIDTRRSKVCKNRPKPTFQTNGANWKMRRKAKLLNKFCQGAFYEAKLYEKAPDVFLEADISGTGVLKVFENIKTGRMEVEQVLETELYVDEAEAINGEPRQLFQVKLIAREVLIGMFPDKEAEIRSAKRASIVGAGFVGDMVEVVEAWHLESYKDAGNGRHGIFCGDEELHGSEYRQQRFPFVFFRPDKPHLGFWGRGVAEVLMGYQLELNRISKRITEIMRKCSVPRTYVSRDAKITRGILNTEVDTIVQYSGRNPPVTVAASYVPQEYFAERRQLKLDALNEVGVSEMDVMSTKPAGLDSAPALREWGDVTSERLSIVFQQYEQFFLDVAYLMIDGAREIARRDTEEGSGARGYRVRMPDKKELAFIDFKDIDLDEDDYVMQAFAASSLPNSPAARKQALFELMQMGIINGVELRRLMDLPDLEESASLATAALDDADATVSAILDDGKQLMPEPQQNLQLLLEYCQAGYLRAKWQKYPRRRLDNLLEFIRNTQGMIQMAEDAAQEKAMAAAAAAAPPPPAGGGGAAPPGIEPVPPMPGPLAQAA